MGTVNGLRYREANPNLTCMTAKHHCIALQDGQHVKEIRYILIQSIGVIEAPESALVKLRSVLAEPLNEIQFGESVIHLFGHSFGFTVAAKSSDCPEDIFIISYQK